MNYRFQINELLQVFDLLPFIRISLNPFGSDEVMQVYPLPLRWSGYPHQLTVNKFVTGI